jgi:glycosyltransferase involved in cell wall biosynthesis
MKKNLVLLFPNFCNVHFYKDVGNVPLWISKSSNLSSVIAVENKNIFKHKPQYFNVSMVNIRKFTNKSSFNAAFFILENYRSIDILHLYHFCFSTIFLSLIYKTLCFFSGKKYIVFVKLDISNEHISFLTSGRNYFFLRLLSLLITQASVETMKDFNSLKKANIFNKLYYLPNAFTLPDCFAKLSKIKKENILLHVTRVGAFQKNTEEFLSVLPDFLYKFRNWVVYIVGPFEINSNLCTNDFYESFPLFKNKVFFTGNMDSRFKIEKLYARSKVIVMTSRYEGFPLSLVEARRWGLKIISTDIKCAREIVKGHSASYLYSSGDKLKLTHHMHTAANSDRYFSTGLFDKERREYSSKNNWPEHLKKLSKDLENECF